MADTVFRTVKPSLKAVDNGDGTYSLGVSLLSGAGIAGIGTLGATAWVVANNAPAKIKAFAQLLQAAGYPAWVCDGTADDVQINAALTSLPANGGRVLLSEGNYYIAASIAITAYDHLEGSGIWSTRLYSAINNISIINVATDASYWSVKNMMLDGESATYALGNGINMNAGMDLCLLEDLIIVDCAEWGIKAGVDGASSGLKVNRVSAWNCKTGGIWLRRFDSMLSISESRFGNLQPFGGMTDAAMKLQSCQETYLNNVGCWMGSPNFAINSCNRVHARGLWSHVGYTNGIVLDATTYSTFIDCMSYASGQDGSGTKVGYICQNTSTRNSFIGCSAFNNLGWFAAPYLDNTQNVGFSENNAVDDFNDYKSCRTKGNVTRPATFRSLNSSFDREVLLPVSLDLSGAATDPLIWFSPVNATLAGYALLYTEASSADAGVSVRIGRYQNGVALDDDYFDIVTSEASKALGYSKHYASPDLSAHVIATGDSITAGTAGGKTGTGEVRVILKIAEGLE